MNDNLKKIGTALGPKEIWFRGLFIVLFFFISYIAAFVLFFVVMFQFFFNLITKKSNEYLLQFGQTLCAYFYEIFNFITYNSDQKPFPFKSWPKASLRADVSSN